MPVINIDDLTDKDKAKMEVEQLKKEVKLERQLVSVRGPGAANFIIALAKPFSFLGKAGKTYPFFFLTLFCIFCLLGSFFCFVFRHCNN